MDKKPLIGLLCSNISTEAYKNIDIEPPIELMQFTPEDINWNDKRISGLILENGVWKKGIRDFPVVVYNRCYTRSTGITRRLERYIGQGKVFNIYTMFDKYETYNFFYDSRLAEYMIPTWPYDPILLIRKLSNGESALIKPAKGSLGSGVIKLNKIGNEYFAYLQTVYPDAVFSTTRELFFYINKVMVKNPYYIIQPFINFMKDEDSVFDMRFLVQKNGDGVWQITADLCRMSFDDFYVTNLAYEIIPVQDVLKQLDLDETIMTQMKDISIEAAMIIEEKVGPFGELCVDFGIEENGRLWIIEINGKPDKSLFKEISHEIYRKALITPLQYAEYLAIH